MEASIKLGLLKTVFILAYFLIVFTAVQAWANTKNQQQQKYIQKQIDEPIMQNETNDEYSHAFHPAP